jgi:transposase
MEKKSKRKFTATFKVKIALDALKGQSTIAELAKKYELHPNQILDWKKVLSERSEGLFSIKGKEIKQQTLILIFKNYIIEIFI